MSDKPESFTFLSCFKCGRIVRSTDEECPRCGMKFGPGTLFECPFCAGLVWRSAERCSTCKTDLVKFSKEIGKNIDSFSMDGFVDDMLETEMKAIHHATLRVACPSCGLMIRGDEDRCPRCDMLLKGVKVDCPVCGEKVMISDEKCKSCGTIFYEIEEEEVEEAKPAKAKSSEAADDEVVKIRAILATAKEAQARAEEKMEHETGERKPKGKKRLGFRRK